MIVPQTLSVGDGETHQPFFSQDLRRFFTSMRGEYGDFVSHPFKARIEHLGDICGAADMVIIEDEDAHLLV